MKPEEIIEHYGHAALLKLAELVGMPHFNHPDELRPAVEAVTGGDLELKAWLVRQAFEAVVPATDWEN